MTVYLDLVMGLNFLVDLLLILGTNRLAGFPAGGKRSVLGALLGSLYSGACLLPGFFFLGNPIWRLVSLVLMGSVAFGWNPGALRRTVVFLFMSMALGGIAISFGRGDAGGVVLAAAVVWLLCHVGFGGSMGQTYVPVEIRHGGKTVKLLALRDTGNTLRDPITGERVLVISGDAARQLTGLNGYQLSHPIETATQAGGYRLIPYHSVGQSGGMLLAKRFSDLTIGGHTGSAVVAFSPELIGRGAVYQALAY